MPVSSHPQGVTRQPANVTTGLAGDQPGAVPYLGSDPSLSDLPTDENGDPVPIQFISDGSSGVTGDDGDLVLAVPNASGGVDLAVNADIGDLLNVGIDDPTGLF